MPTQTIATGRAAAIIVYCGARALRLDCAIVLRFEVQVLSHEEGNEVLRLIIKICLA